ncbi:glycosyl transferase family 1 [Calothrix sp. HK-06]|nr:glycosyl transferase family 1 [Calothrix sp. HK-06]
MEKTINDTLSLWREEGSRQIPQNFEVFRSLVVQAQEFAYNGKYDAAAVYAQTAALNARNKHCGLFVSQELEHILLMIGRKAIQSNFSPCKSISLPTKPRNILHVSTNVSTYSGIPRLIRRWIQQDTERTHSLALTSQAPDVIPEILRDAVLNNQGKIHIINQRTKSIVARSKRLREIASVADIVVLHAWEYDVIPTIAFANKEQFPPVIYVNHGDHWFWLGSSVSDVIANLRESGMRLSQQRRNIEPERNMLLPTVLEPASRVLSRKEAKRKLGIDENSILLLSIARADKYKTIDGVSFADAHLPLLKQNDRAILLVIGPGERENWSKAIEQTQGRIRVLGQTENTAIFYQAADIYVDSFPFVSITSLLEAGSYGVPLVNRFNYSDACEIMAADMPGLNGNLICVRDLQEYTAVLSRLIEDEELRLSLGEATKRKIVETHMGSNWLHSLENVYTHAVTLPRINFRAVATDKMFLGEPDLFYHRIFDSEGETSADLSLAMYLRFLPLDERLRFWTKLVKKYSFRGGRLNLWLGTWLPESSLHYYSRLRSFLSF